MSKLPKILILGRPNVGKSTLINRILKRKLAITHDAPGVTRDIASFNSEWNGKAFILLDSGGIMLAEKDGPDPIQVKVEAMVKKAFESAQKIIFVTDALAGITTFDRAIAKWLRPFEQKVILAANKCENEERQNLAQEFHKLGLGTPVPISATTGGGISDLLDKVTESFGIKESAENEKAEYKIAIVGRPNVGKSSLVNALVNEERVIVHNEAGTTRDAIDIYFQNADAKYVFIDTAGLRKKARIKESVEFYSSVRTQTSIQRADLVIVVLDSQTFLTDQDKKIIQMVLDAKKNMLLFINKWDVTERTDQMRKDLEHIALTEMPFLQNYPFVFGSAKEKLNIGKIISLSPKIILGGEKRISTGKLNHFLEAIFSKNPPTSKMGKRAKIYYVTQVETAPPVFIFFVNDPKLIDKKYLRFLENRFREHIEKFEGNPIQIFLRGKQKDEKRAADFKAKNTRLKIRK